MRSTALIAMLLAITSSARAVPPGYVVETVQVGLSSPINVAFAADGRIFINLRSGAIRVIQDGQLLPTPFATVQVTQSGERGLLGLALHPDFGGNGWVYICYSTPSGGHEIGRFTDVDNIGTDYTAIVTDLPASGIHNGGNIAFGPDGKLYHTIGDNASSGNSQNASTIPGKIHRYQDDGSIPADNPYQNGLLSRYCMGLRNSFDLCWNLDLGLLYASENGPSSNDEVNLILAGENYGWPTVMCSGSFQDALTCWTPTIAPTGITAYTGDNFDAEYANDLFMADYNNGRIWRIDLTADGTGYVGREIFHDDSPIFDVVAAPDGFLYFTNGSSLKRIRKFVDVEAPGDLACEVLGGEDVGLSWMNQGDPYDSIQVARDGVVMEMLPGDAESTTDVAAPAGNHQYSVRGVIGADESAEVICDVTLPLSSPADLECVDAGDGAALSWSNPEPYDSLIVVRDGQLLASLPGDATAYADPGAPPGTVEYGVFGALGPLSSSTSFCSVLVVESFIRGDVTGDGAQNLADPLLLLGHLFLGGPDLECEDAADMNDDEALGLPDVVAILEYLFGGGPGSGACVSDPAGGNLLDCQSYPGCP